MQEFKLIISSIFQSKSYKLANIQKEVLANTCHNQKGYLNNR